MYPNEFDMTLNPLNIFYRKELTMTGIFLSPYTFPRAVELLARLDLKPFVEKYYYIDDCAAAFDEHMGGKYPKVLILCNKDLENL
jgi:(R,R)-butanediol dehydrogenase/meso-butanediol dehydrogenase/diacetyl reductase/L-iditol 2-dehydrogenase